MCHVKLPHRKKVRHYDDPAHCHELTFSCYKRWPLLTNNLWRGMLSDAIDWQWSSARWYEGLPYDANIRLPKLEKLPAEFLAQAAR